MAGKTLIVIPEGSDEVPAGVKVGYLSGSSSTFGFSSVANCLSVTSMTKSGNLEIRIKASSVSGLKYSICYSTSQDNCKESVIYTKDSSFFSKLNETLPLVPPTSNIEFSISSSTPIKIDLDSYDFKNVNLSIIGIPNFYQSVQVTIVNSKKTINTLNISKVELISNCTLSANIVGLHDMKASSNIVVEFKENTAVYTDTSILSSILNTVSKELKITLTDSNTIKMSDDGWIITSSSNSENLVPYNITKMMIFNVKKQMPVFASTIKQAIVPGFNITTSTESKITLKGNWNGPNFSGPLTINHYNNVLNLVYTKAGQGSSIVFLGTGKVHTSLSYESPITICVEFPNDSKCYENKVLSTNFSTALLDYASREYDNITIKAPGSSAEKQVEFKYDDINMLDVTFISEVYSSDVIYVKIASGTKTINTKYTMLAFNKANVDTNISTNKELIFGELELSKTNFSSTFKSLDLKVDKLTADYSNLEHFKKITVIDKIYLTGESLPSKESHVYFQQDQNANDLEMVLPANSKADLLVGAGKLTYGTSVFHITRSEYYDALINLNLCRNLNIIYDNESDISQIPKITIIASSISDIAFYGKYPSSTEDIFQIVSPPGSSSKAGSLITQLQSTAFTLSNSLKAVGTSKRMRLLITASFPSTTSKISHSKPPVLFMLTWQKVVN